MLKTFLKTKWYWWIPIFSIFFIEEMVGWIFNVNKKDLQSKRTAMIYRLLLFHIISIVIAAIVISKFYI